VSKIHPTAVIGEGARLGEGVEVGAYSVIGPNAKVGDRCRIMPHVVLDGWTTLGAECTVFPFASIGTQTQDLKYSGGRTFVEIGERTTLREYVTVNAGTEEGEVTRVGNDCSILAYCHVAHGCRVGNGVIMSNLSTLAGHIVVEDDVVMGGLCGVHQFARVGRLCFVAGLARVAKDCPPFTLVEGNPAKVRGLNSVGLKRKGIAAEAQKKLKQAHRLLWREGLSTSSAVARIEAEIETCPEIRHLVDFIKSSERGITK
jgi:UDP-N-acetylglucosamine acyltransferase